MYIDNDSEPVHLPVYYLPDLIEVIIRNYLFIERGIVHTEFLPFYLAKNSQIFVNIKMQYSTLEITGIENNH